MVKFKTLTKEAIVEINERIPQKHVEGIMQGGDANLDFVVYKTAAARGINQKAAVLMERITQGHIFLNGNKRTAFLAAKIMLELNRKKFDFIHKFTKVQFTLDVHDKKLDEEQIAQWFANHTRNGGKKK